VKKAGFLPDLEIPFSNKTILKACKERRFTAAFARFLYFQACKVNRFNLNLVAMIDDK
jgi:hypothetical protein